MKIIEWDDYFMLFAETAAQRANCHGRKVGAVLVKDRRIIATGYNGTPSGLRNCLDNGCDRCARPEIYGPGQGYDLCICVHAEANCLLMCARFGISTEGATFYSTLQPCFMCLKEMLQAGVEGVIYRDAWASDSASYDYISGHVPLFNQLGQPHRGIVSLQEDIPSGTCT